MYLCGSYFLDHWDSIDFEDKRKAADGMYKEESE